MFDLAAGNGVSPELRDKYRKAYAEQGYLLPELGEEQPVARDEQNRPGDVLHGILREEYGFKVASCKCQEWIDNMNLWGCDGCSTRLSEIVEHLFEEASTNVQVARAIRIGLNVPVIGSYEGRRRITAIVERAIEMARTAPNSRMSQEELAIRLASPAHKWPQNWRNWPNVIEYHRQLVVDAIQEALSAVSKDVPKNPSRGILIPAGGACTVYNKRAGAVPYFWCAYAAAYVLRALGCTLPIQFWFLPGEMEQIEFCELFARRVAATCHVVDTTGMRIAHGWQIKINAILQCQFDQVLHIDADNIVTRDPSYLFDSQQFQDNSAMFWIDNPDINDFHGRIIADQWQRVGSPRRDRINDIETGQMVIDKNRGHRALMVAKHLADHADYWGGFNGGERGVWYGDKTDFHMGFKLTNTPHYLQPWNAWNPGGFFAHCDPSGELLFQHACHCKGHIVNGHAIPNLMHNRLLAEAAAFRSPLEFLDGSIDDAMRVISPEKYFEMEPNRLDRQVWLDVVGRNEYLLPPEFPADSVIIDIGMNSGAFSYACLRRGAGFVLGFEPDPVVCGMAYANCDADRNPQFDCKPWAVWRSDVENGKVTLARAHHERHSGSLSAVIRKSEGSVSAATIGLDRVLEWYPAIHVLKLDCEGSEFPILYTSKLLRKCEHILGEYHNDANPRSAGPIPAGGWPSWHIDGLKAFLESQGFEVYRIIPHSEIHGGFWARRIG